MDRVTERMHTDIAHLKAFQRVLEARMSELEERLKKHEAKRGRPRKEEQDETKR